MEHDLTVVLSLVVGLGLMAQWIAWRFSLPAIVLFALAGLVAGPLMGWLTPSADFGPLYRPIISLCVAIILFEGGLNLRWHELEEAGSGVLRLVSLGAVFSWVLGSGAAHYIGGLSWPVSLLLGAIIIVTGPTVIMPLLRHAHLKRRVSSYLKWEGIINDPIGALLAVLTFQYFVYSGEDGGAGSVFASLAYAVVTALAIGGGTAYALGISFRRAWVPEYLKAPITLGAVLLAYVGSNLVQHEAGLLAVTIMGLVLGNMDLPTMDEMRRFKEYITVMLVSSVFILLTADLTPQTLLELNWPAAWLVVALLFFVRPASIFLATLGTGMHWQDRVLLGWIAPRGIVAAAVAGIFGPQMVEAGYPDGAVLLPLVFALILTTVTLHGLSMRPVANLLGLSAEARRILIVGGSPWTTSLAQALTKEVGVDVLLVDSSYHRLRDARLAGVKVKYVDALSDSFQQSVESTEIYCVLASTSNDAYNALICKEYSSIVEPDHVFQLPAFGSDDTRAGASSIRSNAGMIAFGEKIHYEDLWRRHFQGWKFYKTRLTEAYGYESFLSDAPAEYIMIAILRESGELMFHGPMTPAKPRAGDTIIYYAPDRPADTEARRNGDAENGRRAEPASDEADGVTVA